MRDNLPPNGPKKVESAIVNLDSVNGLGTHWVAYRKQGEVTNYFDSFGNLPPPLELTHYLRRGSYAAKKIYYSYIPEQKFGTVICGHLCLKFLLEKKIK